MKTRKITIGEKFNKLTVISAAARRNKYIKRWECLCECGNKKIVSQSNLTCGYVKSCGCLRKTKYAKKIHGFSHTRFYHIYQGLADRCLNKNNTAFARYGARGIKCWWKSFVDFKNDMYCSYVSHCKEFGEKNTTIDRINNNLGYNKENCRWSTFKVQANNRENNIKNKFLNINNEKITIIDFAKKCKISIYYLQELIKKKYTIDEILNKKYLKRATKIEDYKQILQNNKELYKLPKRSLFIIENRYGLNDNKPKTAKAIGHILNITHQRVLQIEKESLNKIFIL